MAEVRRMTAADVVAGVHVHGGLSGPRVVSTTTAARRRCPGVLRLRDQAVPARRLRLTVWGRGGRRQGPGSARR
jgi:hypothetical protein